MLAPFFHPPLANRPFPTPVKHARYPVRAMTLCIAAHANLGGAPRIVLCFDMLIGDDFGVTESAYKCDLKFAPGLVALIAGRLDDAEDATRLYRKRFADTPPTLDHIKEQLWIGMKQFKETIRRQGRKATDVQFIVAGFLEGEPIILGVDRNEVVSYASYHAIGTGAAWADGMLRWRQMAAPTALYDAMYFVYEAKKFGELSPFVGKRTLINVLEPKERGFRVHSVTWTGIQFLEKKFEELGPRPYPMRRHWDFSSSGLAVDK